MRRYTVRSVESTVFEMDERYGPGFGDVRRWSVVQTGTTIRIRVGTTEEITLSTNPPHGGGEPSTALFVLNALKDLLEDE